MHPKDELELARVAGQRIHFVCMDAGPSSSDDFEFDARCHFLPGIGDRIEHNGKNMQVIRVFHRIVDGSPAGLGDCSIPTVACRYIGANDVTTAEAVKKLIQSLEDIDNP